MTNSSKELSSVSTESLIKENKKHKFKFTDEMVVKLIKLKNSKQYLEYFKSVDGKRNGHSKFWENLASEIDFHLSGFTARKKYNSLLSRYKTQKNLADKSGSGRCTKKYFDLFDTHLPQDYKNHLFKVGVVELGDPEKRVKNSKGFYEPNDDTFLTTRVNESSISYEQSKKQKRIITKSDLDIKHMDAMEAIINTATIFKEMVVSDKKVDDLKSNLNEYKNTIDNKFNETNKILGSILDKLDKLNK